MTKGKLITLEGIDGSGKTTAVPHIKSYLKSKGIKVITTKAPGGSVIGPHIKDALAENITPEAETLLFLAALELVAAYTILPALNSGKWVICDRYIHSALAYQGYGKKIPIHHIVQIITSMFPACLPDLTIYFDVSIETAKERLQKRSALDKFETTGQNFYRDVKQGYETIQTRMPKHFKIINAEVHPEDVIKQITQVIDENLQYAS